jgi:ribonuclease BN (tRNA processing enzyme)
LFALVCAYALSLVFTSDAAGASAADSTKAQAAQAVNHPASVQVVFLGTGTPAPDPETQGPANMVVVDGKPYIVDAGTGVVRQTQAAYRVGISIRPAQLDIAFITHLHSDHTLGLADLILTPWVMRRTAPLELYGPEGTKAMAEDLLHAYRQDIHIRLTGGEAANSTGYKVNAHDIQPGVIYQDDKVKVTAFQVKHGTWPEALGYRFDAEGKSIVFSGDTRPTESVVQACHGCDVLVHEAYVGDSKDAWMVYMRKFHTSASELGEIAARAKPKLLVVTHEGYVDGTSEADMLADIRKSFKGAVKIAHDLDVVTP